MKEKEDLIREIDKILGIPEMTTDIELKKIFSASKIAIEENQVQAISQLSHSLSLYLMTHHYKAPKNVIEFATKIANKYHRERGKISALNMLAMSFHGLK
ncbi:bacteriocin immunity protein [Streptococcus sp. 10F2]